MNMLLQAVILAFALLSIEVWGDPNVVTIQPTNFYISNVTSSRVNTPLAAMNDFYYMVDSNSLNRVQKRLIGSTVTASFASLGSGSSSIVDVVTYVDSLNVEYLLTADSSSNIRMFKVSDSSTTLFTVNFPGFVAFTVHEAQLYAVSANVIRSWDLVTLSTNAVIDNTYNALLRNFTCIAADSQSVYVCDQNTGGTPLQRSSSTGVLSSLVSPGGQLGSNLKAPKRIIAGKHTNLVYYSLTEPYVQIVSHNTVSGDFFGMYVGDGSATEAGAFDIIANDVVYVTYTNSIVSLLVNSNDYVLGQLRSTNLYDRYLAYNGVKFVNLRIQGTFMVAATTAGQIHQYNLAFSTSKTATSLSLAAGNANAQFSVFATNLINMLKFANSSFFIDNPTVKLGQNLCQNVTMTNPLTTGSNIYSCVVTKYSGAPAGLESVFILPKSVRAISTGSIAFSALTYQIMPAFGVNTYQLFTAGSENVTIKFSGYKNIAASSLLIVLYNFQYRQYYCTDVQLIAPETIQCLSPKSNQPFGLQLYLFVDLTYLTYTPDYFMYKKPNFTSISQVDNLNTLGGQKLYINGSGFGQCGAGDPQYSCLPFYVSLNGVVQQQKILNDTTIEFTTVAGVGRNLVVLVGFNQEDLTSTQLRTAYANNYIYTLAQTLAYNPPELFNVTDPVRQFMTDDIIMFNGRYFGQNSAISRPKIYLISLNGRLNQSLIAYPATPSQVPINVNQFADGMMAIQFRQASFPLLPGTYQVQIEIGGQNSTQNNVTLQSLAFAPSMSSSSLTLLENEFVSLPVTASSVYGEAAILFQITKLPDRGKIYYLPIAPNNVVNYVPNFAASSPITADQLSYSPLDLKFYNLYYKPDLYFYGSDSIEVTAETYGALSNVSVFSLDVTFVNQAPMNMQPSSINLQEDLRQPIVLSVFDPDDSEFGYVITELPSVGILYDDQLNVTITSVPHLIGNGTAINGTVSYQPKQYEFRNNYDNFRWTATDSRRVTSSSASTVINVEFTNHDPVAYPVKAETLELTPVSFALNATDFDSIDVSSLKYYISQLPQNGTLYQVKSDGTRDTIPFTVVGLKVTNSLHRVMWSPNANEYFNGVDTIEYMVEDQHGATSSSIVEIYVGFVDQAPEFKSTVLTAVLSDSTTAASVLVDIIDPDEFSNYTVYLKEDAIRGNWFVNNVNNLLTTSGFIISAGVPLQVLVNYDGKGGFYPAATIQLLANDSYGAQSLNTLTLEVSIECPPLLYNNVWSEEGDICAPCPAGAFCAADGSELPYNQLGFYPVSRSEFLECVPKEACPVEAEITEVSEYKCAVGYAGTRCGGCENLYYRSGNFCNKCPDNNISLPVLVFLGILALTVVLVFVNLLRRVDDGYIGILITFVQTMGVLSSFQLNWPISVMRLFTVFSALNFNIEIVSPECYTGDSKTSYETKYFFTMLLPLALFAFVTFLILVTWFMQYFHIGIDGIKKGMRYLSEMRNAYVAKKVKTQEDAEKRFEEAKLKKVQPHDDGSDSTFASSLTMVFLMAMELLYLTLAQRSVEIFACAPSTNGGFFFLLDPSRKCYEEDWWKALLPWSIFGMFAYIFAIPAVFIFMYYKRIQVLKVPAAERSYFQKFILRLTYKKLHTFKEQYDYWNIVVLIRKLLIIMAGLFFVNLRALQAELLILILLGSMVLQQRKPFIHETLNFLENATLISSILVLSAGLLAYVGDFNFEQTEVLGVIIIMIIGICTITLFYKLVLHFRSMYERKKMAASVRNSVVPGAEMTAELSSSEYGLLGSVDRTSQLRTEIPIYDNNANETNIFGEPLRQSPHASQEFKASAQSGPTDALLNHGEEQQPQLVPKGKKYKKNIKKTRKVNYSLDDLASDEDYESEEGIDT